MALSWLSSKYGVTLGYEAFKNQYHYAVRRLKKRLNIIKSNKFLQACLNGGVDIFKEIKKHRGKNGQLPNNVDGFVGDENISNHFKDIYTDLFNSVPSNDELKEILQTININLCPDDLSKVSEVDSITVNKAINKLRLGKSDSKYNFGSDAFIHGSNALSEKLAFLFQTF